MNNFLGVLIAPHPPIVISEVGKGREHEAQSTINGMEKLAEIVSKKKPETIICITPHGNVFRDEICILYENEIEGNLAKFGVAELAMKKEVDISLLKKIDSELRDKNISHILLNKTIAESYSCKPEIDHGCFVPLHYFDKTGHKYKIIHITIHMNDLIDLYETGKVLRKAIEESDTKVMVLASADLSHCLNQNEPDKYHPKGKVFDEIVTKAIKSGSYEDIIGMEEDIYVNAAECGLRPIVFALGTLDAYVSVGKVFSYEAPFGVGYMTAFIETLSEKKESLLEEHHIRKIERYESVKRKENIFVTLARETIEVWVKTRTRLDWHKFKSIILQSKLINKLESTKAGTFVSIHKNGKLRGCIGTIGPTHPNIAHEIISNAIQASSYDTRFEPINEEELLALEIKVDVLGEIEEVKDIGDLDVEKYGVIVEYEGRRGLLLPNIEGINSVHEQISIAKQKAGIGNDKQVKLSRFEVTRYS
ncbi:MAG: AMMECR1 domain-containing protein [Alkaliphilus sp.]|nr:AmmeMemoRadiSam system protein A [bacterium AH-315-K05]PHS30776.1 MAG: AMMECR1 domain-containing protein [Alkaliphilus sp.]